MSQALSRREVLLGGTASLLAAAAVGSSAVQPVAAQEAAVTSPPAEFRFCLNTSTIRGQKLDLVTEIEITSKAGYTGIEPWIREIDEYTKAGGTLPDLAKRIKDAGLQVESAIGFAEWIVENPEKRKAGLEEAKRTMDIVAQLGGSRIAAPPVGATKEPTLKLTDVADRYKALCEVGAQLGVAPELEVWGFSHNLSRLGEVLFVTGESAHPLACLLLDVYHLHRGGSDFGGLRQIAGQAMPCFHMNDYPAAADRTRLNDSDRVYPGDGVAPWKEIIGTFRKNGFRGALSLELFNPEYWKQDPLTVARTGLEKMRAVVG